MDSRVEQFLQQFATRSTENLYNDLFNRIKTLNGNDFDRAISSIRSMFHRDQQGSTPPPAGGSTAGGSGTTANDVETAMVTGMEAVSINDLPGPPPNSQPQPIEPPPSTAIVPSSVSTRLSESSIITVPVPPEEPEESALALVPSAPPASPSQDEIIYLSNEDLPNLQPLYTYLNRQQQASVEQAVEPHRRSDRRTSVFDTFSTVLLDVIYQMEQDQRRQRLHPTSSALHIEDEDQPESSVVVPPPRTSSSRASESLDEIPTRMLWTEDMEIDDRGGLLNRLDELAGQMAQMSLQDSLRQQESYYKKISKRFPENWVYYPESFMDIFLNLMVTCAFSQIVLIALINYNHLKRESAQRHPELKECIQFYDENKDLFPKYIICYCTIQIIQGKCQVDPTVHFHPFDNYMKFISEHPLPTECNFITKRLTADKVLDLYYTYVINHLDFGNSTSSTDIELVKNSYVVPYGIGMGYQSMYVNVHKLIYYEIYEQTASDISEIPQLKDRILFLAYVNVSKMVFFDLQLKKLLILPGEETTTAQLLTNYLGNTANHHQTESPTTAGERTEETIVRLLNVAGIPFHTRINQQEFDAQQLSVTLVLSEPIGGGLEFFRKGKVTARLLKLDPAKATFTHAPGSTYFAAPWHFIGYLGGPSDDNSSLRLTRNWMECLKFENKVVRDKCFHQQLQRTRAIQQFGKIQRHCAKHNVYVSAVKFGTGNSSKNSPSFMTYVFNTSNQWRRNRQNKLEGSWKSIGSLRDLVQRQSNSKSKFRATLDGLKNFFSLNTISHKHRSHNVVQLPPMSPTSFGYIQTCRSCPNVRDYLQLYPMGNPNAYFEGPHKGVSSALSQQESNTLVKKCHHCFGTSRRTTRGAAAPANTWEPRSVYNSYTRTYQDGIANNVLTNPYGGVTGIVGYPGWSDVTLEQGLVPYKTKRRM